MFRYLLAASALACAFSLPLGAATDSSTLTVTVMVEPSCEIFDATLDFGTIASAIDSQVLAVTSVAVDCDSSATFTISGNQGQHADGGERRMQHAGGSHLVYRLYLDAARTLPLTDTPTEVAPGAGGSSFNIYGTIPASQTAAPGQYSDSVLLTITF